ALGAAMRRSHTSIWKWVHRYRYSPVLGYTREHGGGVQGAHRAGGEAPQEDGRAPRVGCGIL
ncbi:MAG: hypothetical protein ACP5QE_06600, partial [Conexivisphaera sp.]